jgi:hypothetical protein
MRSRLPGSAPLERLAGLRSTDHKKGIHTYWSRVKTEARPKAAKTSTILTVKKQSAVGF